jgi:hypothetical protein
MTDRVDQKRLRLPSFPFCGFRHFPDQEIAMDSIQPARSGAKPPPRGQAAPGQLNGALKYFRDDPARPFGRW